MNHKKRISCFMVFALFLSLCAGSGTFNPNTAFAYDAPPKDQGHTGPDPKGAKNSNPGGDPNRGKKGDDPIDIGSGNFIHEQNDLFIKGRIPFEISRTYNCQDLYEGPFGYGWTYTYHIDLTEVTEGSTTKVSFRKEGKRIAFTDNGDGTYSSPSGYFYTLTKTGGGWVLKIGKGQTYSFDSSGHVTAFKDRNGNQLSFTHDSTGRLSTVSDGLGRALTFGYGSNNKISTITDPAGLTRTYGYDGNSNLVSFTDPGGNTIAYAYDDQHRLTGITDPKGTTFLVNTYDAQNRVTQQFYNGDTSLYYYYSGYTQFKNSLNYTSTTYFNSTGNPTTATDFLGRTTYRTWDANMHLTSFRDARGYTTSYTYDGNGNLIKMTDPQGNTVTFTIDPTSNNVTKITDPLGRTARTYAYDSKGNLTKVTDAAGKDTLFTYNSYGDLASTTDALGNTVSYTYDVYGRLTASTDPLGHTTTCTYDILGNLTGKTDHRGITTTYAYDALGRLTKITDTYGGYLAFTYDANGNRLTMSDALGSTTSYTYSTYNQPLSVTDSLGDQTQFAYDVSGNLLSVKDAQGNTSTMTYDAMNRVVTEVDALGNTTTYAYDANDNLVSITDPRGKKTTFAYTTLNKLSSMTFPDGSTEQYTYNKMGNLITVKDRKGNTINNTFDVLNRPITKTYPDASTQTFAYDALNRVTSSSNGSIKLDYAYDAIGRLTQSNQNGVLVKYAFDDSANTFKLTYPNGFYVIYAYNDANALKQVQDSSGTVVASYTYDVMGRRKQLDLANGTRSLYSFDARSNILSLVNQTSGGSSISSFTHTYDKAGNRLTVQTPQGTHSYTYDVIGRLTKATTPDLTSTTFNLDAVGNRVSTINGGTTNYAINDLNQYLTVGAATYAYDAKGSMTSDGVNTYKYDYENRISQIVTPTQTISYAYDAEGRRVSKTDSSGTTKYIFDRSQVIAETDNSGNVQAIYVNGETIDEVLTMTRGANTYYYHYDGTGSVANLTGSSGTVVESYSYDVYGWPKTTSAVGNSSMFTGRNFEPETGLYFYRARHYQPKLGRFLQTDPLGYLRETNLYTYCWNNPLLFKDPFGLDWWETWAELADVRAAREQWRQWDIPVVSKVMDFMAGMVQFAQDDAQVMGYHGITSRKGMWALTSFTFNSFLMISAHPAVGKGVGNLMVKGAARLLPAGGLNLGKYVLVARFKEVAGKAYTAIEPIWVGIEKVVQGAAQGQGIIHAGVAPAYGGAHIGLNFLANTHIYLSHIRVGAQTELFTLPFGGSFIYRGIKGQFEYHGRTDYGKPDP